MISILISVWEFAVYGVKHRSEIPAEYIGNVSQNLLSLWLWAVVNDVNHIKCVISKTVLALVL